MSGAAKKKVQVKPWYKEKFARAHYLRHGEPEVFTDENIPTKVVGWIAITDEEMAQWDDAKQVVEQKDKKRENLITTTGPYATENNTLKMNIEILCADRKGFEYSAEADTKEKLNRKFWPTVIKLIAHLMAPRIAGRPVLENGEAQPSSSNY